MEIEVAGKLFWNDHDYYLVDIHPVLEREHWMKDTDEKFKVCQENGHVFEIIVSRPFLVSRLNMGKRIEVKAYKQEVDLEKSYAFEGEDLDELQEITHELFQTNKI